MTAEKKNSEILKEVCELSRRGKFLEARDVIIQAAGIDVRELENIPAGGRGDYILSKNKNPNVRKMIAVERAFYNLAALFYRRGDESPSVVDARRCIDGLNEVMPVLNKEQQTYAQFWMSNCYLYAEPENDDVRYDLLTEVIKNTPKGKPGSDSLYASCAVKFRDMNVPAEKKYQGVKLAQGKTDKNHPLIKGYDDILPKLARAYYDVLLSRADNRQEEYSVRNKSYETALEVVNDFDIPKIHKNAYKLYLLERQTMLQREHGDREHYSPSMRRKQNLIYQQAALKRGRGVARMTNENYR